MVSTVADVRPGQTPAKRLRPGSGVPVDPGKLTWMRNNRKLTRDQLSDRIAKVSLEQGIVDNHGDPVTYSRDAVAKLENGERKPKMYTFMAICAALDCDAADLQEDFPGGQPSSVPSLMPSVEEVAQLLGDSTDPVDTLRDQLTTRAWNSVSKRTDCTTVGDLARTSSDGSLEDTRNLGFVQLTEIRRVLALMAMDLIAANEASTENDVAKAG